MRSSTVQLYSAPQALSGQAPLARKKTPFRSAYDLQQQKTEKAVQFAGARLQIDGQGRFDSISIRKPTEWQKFQARMMHWIRQYDPLLMEGMLFIEMGTLQIPVWSAQQIVLAMENVAEQEFKGDGFRKHKKAISANKKMMEALAPGMNALLTHLQTLEPQVPLKKPFWEQQLMKFIDPDGFIDWATGPRTFSKEISFWLNGGKVQPSQPIDLGEIATAMTGQLTQAAGEVLRAIGGKEAIEGTSPKSITSGQRPTTSSKEIAVRGSQSPQKTEDPGRQKMAVSCEPAWKRCFYTVAEFFGFRTPPPRMLQRKDIAMAGEILNRIYNDEKNYRMRDHIRLGRNFIGIDFVRPLEDWEMLGIYDN